MATNRQIFKDMLLHGLRLIRVGNGQANEVQTQLRKLGNSMRSRILQSADPSATRAELNSLVASMNKDVRDVYDRIIRDQQDALARLLRVDSKLMQRVGDLPEAPSNAALRAAEGRMLIQGAAVEQHWRKQAADTAFKSAAAVRQGVANGETARDVAQRVVGVGRAQRGGVLEQQRRHASTLAKDTVQRATEVGRKATLQANGIDAARWTAILDAAVCPHCALRDGKMYRVDNNEPIGHNVPMESEPPLHRNCRCMLVPEMHDGGPPPDGGAATDRGERFLAQLSKPEQEEVLGVGRAALFRQGDITLRDLMDQNGMILPLEELERLV